MVYFPFRAFFKQSQICSQVVHSFGFSVTFFPFPYFAPKSFLPLLHPVVGMTSAILPLLVGRIFFRSFGNFSFVCIVSAVSFIVLFFVLLAMLFQFGLHIFQSYVSVFFEVYLVVFFCDSSLGSQTIFTFCLWSSRGPQIFH